MARCHTANSVTNLLNENVTEYIRKDIMKKILYKNLKRYEDIKGLSAAMSYAWERLKKNSSITQSTNGGCD